MAGPRVGVTQRVEDLPERGERRDCLDQQWAVLLEGMGMVPVPIPNRLADVAAFVDATALALVVLSGGNDLAHLPGAIAPASERDATEAQLLDVASHRGLPVLGVCRGLQLMVTRAGGKLSRVDGHVRAPHAVVVDSATWPLREGRVVNSFHDWGVAPDATGTLVPLAHAPDGTVEAACHPVLPHVGVMWHPERAPQDPADLDLIRALLEHDPHASSRPRGG
jgi:gamma-glutamyl-gamma-aminobutyrate hydrolase PuuD